MGDVFRGDPGEKLDPRVAEIGRRYGVGKPVFNWVASEPRWEAFSESCYSVNFSPNLAVLDAAWGTRKGMSGLVRLG